MELQAPPQPPGMRPAFKTPAMLVLPPDPSSQPPALETEPSPESQPVKRGRGRPRTVTTAFDDTRTPTSSPGRPAVHDPATGALLDPVVLPTPAEFDELLRQDQKAAKRDLPKIDAKIAVQAGIVIVGILAMAGGWAVRRVHRGTATLRKPNKAEAKAIAEPIAAILARHVTKGEDMADLFSLADCVMAIDLYLDAGPLLVPSVHPGQIPQMRNPQEM